MPKTALVINPWVTDFKLYDEWMHPAGLYFLISLLKHNGFIVHYFNCLQRPLHARQKYCNTGDFEQREFPKPPVYSALKRRYKLYGRPREALESFLSSVPAADLICIGSGMPYWLPGLIETAHTVNKYFPKTPIVIGGISAKLIPSHIKTSLPDAHVFSGTLFSQSSLKNSGIPIVATLQSTLWEPSLYEAYQEFTFAHHGPVISSLGCPMSCSYCASRILQETFFVRNPDVVVGEIEYLRSRFGVQNFAIFDDALLYDPDRHCMPLMESILARGLNVHFHAPNGLHIRWLSPVIFDIMKRVGFKTLRFGYESGDARYSRDTAGKASREELAEKIRMALESGFANASVGVYVMAGLPGQSQEDVLREIEFVSSLSVKVKPVFLSPVPHTNLFERYVSSFPELADDPLLHNDTFFITRLPGWDAQAMQGVIDAAKKRNAFITGTTH